MDQLAYYPFVIVRVACSQCGRNGQYRLARLAAKYGPEISAEDLLDRLAFDCPYREPRYAPPKRRRKYQAVCKARLIDLDPPRVPPDLPADMLRLRVVEGGKKSA